MPDLNVRLALYRRLSDAERPEDREALAAELIDRFGPLPEEAGQLLKVVAIKGLCRQANVAKIDVGPKGAVISFRDDRFANPGPGQLRPETPRHLARAAGPEGGGQGRVGDPRPSAWTRRSASWANWRGWRWRREPNLPHLLGKEGPAAKRWEDGVTARWRVQR